MKRWVSFLVVLSLWISLFMSHDAMAQYSSDWINFSQTYYKVPVAKTGVYRLTYNDLQSAGVPINSIDPRRINLFHRGVEQAIFVQGQADAHFDPPDYLEFYGQRNDGTLDSDIYQSPGLQPHPYYNLFTDTTAYFLTWNPLPVLGKRMNLVFQTNGTGIPAEPFHLDEQLRVYTDEYAGGLTFSNEIQSTAFDQGEGWTGKLICTGFSACTGQQDFTIDKLLHGDPGALPSIELLLVGRNELSHNADIFAGPDAGSLRLLTTTSFAGFSTKLITLPLLLTDIGSDGKITVRVRINSSGNDQVSVSYIKINFAQNFNIQSAAEKTLHLIPNGANKSYVEVSNTLAGTRVWDISDPSAVDMIGTSAITGGISMVVPGTSNGKELFLAAATLAATVEKASFRSIIPSAHNYIIISNRALMKPALGYSDAVESYASYRASTAGGSYDTLTLPIDLLYDQFNYGETSPRAIYELMKFLVNNGDPKFLFLIGKGIEVSQGYYRKPSLAPTDFRDLVPSAGMPGGDMAFTAGLDGTTYEPAVPTGRLTATTATQVAAYLNKIIEAEALPHDALWQKDLLHLSGGIHVGEPEIFRQYVDGFKAIAESYYFGGTVSTISKQTLNVELINVKDKVNKGLSLVTFYGHSGPGTIDIDIGYVSDPTLGYNNQGKYPAFLINGCNAGRFFDNRLTFGEDWMLTPNKGAKAFIAHSFFGFTSTLKQYSDLFYEVAFADSTYLKMGIGEVQKEVGRRYLAASGNSLSAVTQVQQMVLLGDPAVKIFGADKPDYKTSNGEVKINSIDGKPVTIASTSFALDIHVENFGRAQPDPLKIRVQRTLSDNSLITYDSTFNPLLYANDLRFIIRKGRSDAESGTSRFTITIDPDNETSELSESNNTATLTFFIPRNGTQHLFPAPFSIVNTASVNLVFQNTNLLASTRTFRIEIDTAATFDSPWLSRQVITGKVLVKIPLVLQTKDSLVYYWRTKFDLPQGDESTDWFVSSFTFIDHGPVGWALMQFPQLETGLVDGLVADESLKRFNFKETVSSVDVTTYGNTHPASYTEVSLKINGEEFNVSSQGQPCRNNSLNLIAFDKNSTAPYAGIPFSLFDPRSCGREPQMINNYLPPEMDQADGISQWVANLGPSDSVVLFSIGDAGYASWSPLTILNLNLLGIGPSQLNGLQPGEPFIIFGKKNAPVGSALVIRTSTGPVTAQQLNAQKTITGRFSEASLASAIIGPARHWTDLTARVAEVTPNDEFHILVTGLDAQLQSTVLKDVQAGTTDLTDIDPQLYPYLQLTWKVKDDIDLTAAQLKKWLVTFSPVPEGILTYKGPTQQVTVQEGEKWETGYGFVNISDQDFLDSLHVQLNIFSTDQRKTETNTFKIKKPAPGDTTLFSYSIITLGKAGANDINLIVNPQVEPEMYYENNQLAFYNQLLVQADHTSPVLDVTVDGRYLTNGERVSSSPMIKALVIDRNPFQLKTDTTGINLFVRVPCSTGPCDFRRINFSQSDVQWVPATPTADFQVIYHPVKLDTGTYFLRVEAVDASGNSSGDVPYEVSFEVKTDVNFTIRSVYPNPSKESFNFELSISGMGAPDAFQLDIYSTKGELVRTLANDALPSMHVGTNVITIGATDAAGNPLAPGLFLYRMTGTFGGTQFVHTGKLVVVGW